MLVEAVQCHTCGDVIYPRARDDVRWCSCGAVVIDGERRYLGITGYRSNHHCLELWLDADEKTLYDDLNQGIGKFGRISLDKQ